MFARQVFRPARAVQVQAKRLASTSAASSGGKGGILLLGGAVASGGGYFLYRQRNSAEFQEAREKGKAVVDKAKDVAHEAKEKVKGSAASVTSSVSSSSGDTAGAAAAGEKTFTGGEQGFVSLVLEKTDVVNHNTKLLRFKLPSDEHVSGLEIASALLTKYKGPDMEKPVLRPYTPTSDEDQRGYIDLVVKKYPNGPMSTHLHDMEPGQRLDFKGPLPKYPWSPNKHEHIALITGGTGITPMWQLARAIFKNPEDKTKVTLVFGNIKEEDILLKKELEELENTYPRRFRAFYTLDDPTGTWSGTKGVISKELLKTVLPEPKEGEKIKIFVCGPPGLYKAISGTKKSPRDQGELDGVLKELGYSKEQVYKF